LRDLSRNVHWAGRVVQSWRGGARCLADEYCGSGRGFFLLQYAVRAPRLQEKAEKAGEGWGETLNIEDGFAASLPAGRVTEEKLR